MQEVKATQTQQTAETKKKMTPEERWRKKLVEQANEAVQGSDHDFSSFLRKLSVMMDTYNSKSAVAVVQAKRFTERAKFCENLLIGMVTKRKNGKQS